MVLMAAASDFSQVNFFSQSFAARRIVGARAGRKAIFSL
jgi:hypothetical protein